MQVQPIISVDEVDTVVPPIHIASAPAEDELEQTLEDTRINISTIQLMTSMPTAPVLDDMPHIIPGKFRLIQLSVIQQWINLNILFSSSSTSSFGKISRITPGKYCECQSQNSQALH